MDETNTPGDKTLLIVYHSQSGNTEILADAVQRGALREENVVIKRLAACRVTTEDLTRCRALVICSPEYFGYMAGAVKDMFDRTYEHVREKMSGKSYCIVVCAGNDGTGALKSIERIVAGWNLKKVQEPVFCRGPVTEEALAKCRELGQTLAAGISFGIY
jgi:multimeric flavodoxin WrbA